MDKIDTFARWLLKWAVITFIVLATTFVLAGLSGFLDMTPEEKAALDAKREKTAQTKAMLKAVSDAKQKQMAQARESVIDLNKIAKYGYGEIVDRNEYGSEWPYPTTDVGILRCKILDFGFGTSSRPFITIEINSFVYGVNGVAIGKMGMPNSEQLMVRGEYGEYVIGAISDIIQRAIGGCR